MAKVYCETQDGKYLLKEAKSIPIRIGAYGILLKNGKVLLTKTYLPLWEFPGGGVKKGETLLEALEREFSEETGLNIESKKLVLERESFYLSPTGRVFHSFQNFFLVKLSTNRNSMRRKLKDGACWIALGELKIGNMKRSAYDALRFFLGEDRSSIFMSASR